MPEPSFEEIEKVKKEKEEKPLRIFPFGVNRQNLERALRAMQLPAVTVLILDDADMVLTTKPKARAGTKIMLLAEEHKLPIHVIRKNVSSQIIKFLKYYFRVGGKEESEGIALREAEDAIEHVKETGKSADLSPQNAYIRRLQHQKVEEAGLHSESVGEEPKRRIRIYP